jgi:hypothetical protein
MVWKHVRGFAGDLPGLGGCIAEENDPGSALCRHLHCGDEKLIWRLGHLHSDSAARPAKVLVWCEKDSVEFVATE